MGWRVWTLVGWGRGVVRAMGPTSMHQILVCPWYPTALTNLSRVCYSRKKAAAGALVLRSQDAARFSRIPTRRTTLGVKGHRPMVGTLDGHAGVDVFAALTLVTGQWTTRLVARLQKAKKPGPSKPRYVQEGLARHRRDSARTSPAAPSPPWCV